MFKKMKKNKNNSKKTIMMIIPKLFPVPDVNGGGVELLITHLLNENEKHNKVRLIVISKYDEKAARIRYKNSKVYYFQDNLLVDDYIRNEKLMWCVYHFFQRVRRKMFHNRITNKIFKNNMIILNRYMFQCTLLAKKEHIDTLILENLPASVDYQPIVNYVGRNSSYIHLHIHRNDNNQERSVIPNSISISEYIKNEWIKGKEVQGKNEILYNCIDLGKYNLKENGDFREKKRAELGFKQDDLVVVFCGRIMPIKGVKELLDAFELIEDSNVKLMLIGSVYYSLNRKSEYADKIVERANKMQNVTYLGYIPNTEMQNYYSISDIQVVPSTGNEGAGLVVLEGMASGLPLIITDSGGMVEYANEKCAEIIPIDESISENIAQKIKKLADNNELRKKMGEAGKQQVQQYSKENYYYNFVRIVST